MRTIRSSRRGSQKEISLTDWQKSSRITSEREKERTTSCNSKTRVSHMPLRIRSSSLSSSRSFHVISLSVTRVYIFTSVSVSPSLSILSLSIHFFFFLGLFSLFPSSLDLPAKPTERFNPLPIVKINGDRARFFLHSFRFDLRRGPSQCAAAAPFYFRTHENRCLCFWPLLSDDEARRYAYLCRSRNLYHLETSLVFQKTFKTLNNFHRNFSLKVLFLIAYPLISFANIFLFLYFI